jgi:hypothetical protein
VNKVHYNLIKYGDDSVILELKIPVEIHITQTTCKVSYPRVEVKSVHYVEIKHVENLIILESRIISQTYT